MGNTSVSAVVLGGLLEQGIDKVVGAAKAFENFDYEFIMSDMIELINPDTLVIEILETVKIDSILLNRIQELRNKGYKIALDDFEDDYYTFPAVSMADIIKYDVISTPLDTIRMGLQEIERWINMLILQKLAGDKPDEIFSLSLVRSKFCEDVADISSFKDRKDEASMMCLFSMLDVILDCSMEEALEGLAISQDIFDAPIYGTGVFNPLCMLLQAAYFI